MRSENIRVKNMGELIISEVKFKSSTVLTKEETDFLIELIEETEFLDVANVAVYYLSAESLEWLKKEALTPEEKEKYERLIKILEKFKDKEIALSA